MDTENYSPNELVEQTIKALEDRLCDPKTSTEQKAFCMDKLTLIKQFNLPISKLEAISPDDLVNAMKVTCYGNLMYCLPAGTMILMANFTWKPIENITKFEEVMGLAKNKQGKLAFQKSKVLGTGSRLCSTLTLKTKNGELEPTPDHPILGETSGRKYSLRYREAGKIHAGDYARFLLAPIVLQENVDYTKGWLTGYTEGDGSFYNRKYYPGKQNAKRQFKAASKDVEITEAITTRAEKFGIALIPAKCQSSQNGFSHGQVYDGVAAYQYEMAEELEQLCQYEMNGTEDFHRGYLAGIFDAEGSMENKCNPQIILCQHYEKHPDIFLHMKNSLTTLRFQFKVDTPKRKQNTHIRILGGTLATLRFLIETRPVLKRKINKFFNGHSFKKGFAPQEIIIAQIHQEQKTVHNIATETRNYIANGFIVHNCCGLAKNCLWRDAARAALHMNDACYTSKENGITDLVIATKRKLVVPEKTAT